MSYMEKNPGALDATGVGGDLLSSNPSESIPRAPALQAPLAQPYRYAPYNVEVEQAILGTILVDNQALERASAILKPEQFYDPLHARIFETMSRMIERSGVVVTPLTLHATMKADPGVMEMGGQGYFDSLQSAAPAFPNIGTLSNMIADLAIRRSLIQFGQDIIDDAYAPPDDISTAAQIAAAEWRLKAVVLSGAAILDQGGRIELKPFASIALRPVRRDLIQGMIPRVGLTVAWGPPKCGKSFVTFDLAMHVALSWKYRGRRVHQGPVVYCAFEGQSGMEARVAAFRQRKMEGIEQPVPFYLQAARLDLVSDHPALIAAIRNQLAGAAPVLVVLDTLNRSIRGSESSDLDMGAYIAAADAIREAFDCSVLIVHHCGINDARPRGHTSLTGAVEAQLSVKRDGADNIIVEVELSKDGPQGEKLVYRLEEVEVGTDEDGQPIKSCVIVPSDAAPAPNFRRKLTDRQKNGVVCLQSLIASAGEPVPASFGLPGAVLSVKTTSWQDEVFRCDILDPKGKNPRADFARLRNSLRARQMIGVRDGLVWLV